MTNRKSFILHLDSLCILDKMTNEQAGKLIKAIYEYQKTSNVPELDFAMDMAITPFLNQFKRDENSYQKTVERNRINGSKGGRPKNPKKPKKPSGLIQNPTKPKKADSDSKSDNDNDSVSNNDSKKDSKSKKEKLVLPFDSLEFKKAWENWKVYKQKEFNFNFKSLQSQQASLSELNNKSKGNENTAIEIIHQSMSNGWKGFFKLKKENDEKRNSSQGGVQYSDAFKERLLKKLQS